MPKSGASYHRVRMMALESVEKELGDTAVIKKVYHCHGQGSAIAGFDHKGLHTLWGYHRKIFNQVHLLIVCSSAGWVAVSAFASVPTGKSEPILTHSYPSLTGIGIA